jgi:hypothetical protein
MKPLAHDQEVSETSRQSNAKVSRGGARPFQPGHSPFISARVFPSSLRLDKTRAELTLAMEVTERYALEMLNNGIVAPWLHGSRVLHGLWSGRKHRPDSPIGAIDKPSRGHQFR